MRLRYFFYFTSLVLFFIANGVIFYVCNKPGNVTSSEKVGLTYDENIFTDKKIVADAQTKISSDGKYKVFTTFKDYGLAESTIHLISTDKTVYKRVAKSQNARFISSPIFNPEGNKILFTRLYPSEIWMYDIVEMTYILVYSEARSGKSSVFNPAIGYLGQVNLEFLENNIKFENNKVYPEEIVTLDLQTRVKESHTVESLESSFEKVRIQSQRDTSWGDIMLGSCEDQTIHTAGCAVTSASMAFKSLGIDKIDPGQLNAFLQENNDQGYFDGCNIKWYIAQNFNQGIELKGAYFNEFDTERVDYELSQGNAVIIGFNYVPYTGIQHWVQVIGKEEGKYIINDPWELNNVKKTLSDFGGKFDHIVVYRKASSIL